MSTIIRFIIFIFLSIHSLLCAESEVELEDLSHKSPSVLDLENDIRRRLDIDLEEFNSSTDEQSAFELTTAILSREGIGSPDLAEVLSMTSGEDVVNWLDSEIINKKDPLSECANKGLMIFGSASATARGSVYFILGYKLSENYLVTAIKSPVKHALSVAYASASSVPMTILGAGSSHKFLKYLITPASQNYINIKKEESCCEKSFRISKNGLLIIASACSASILTYIAYDNFHPLIGWFWLVPGLPTFYVRTLIDFYAMEQLGSAAYEKFISGPKNKKLHESQPGSRGANIHEIKELLENSRNFVASLQHKQAKILEDIVKDSEEDVAQKVKVLTNPAFFVRDNVYITKSSWLREAVGYIGGTVAVCGMYLYYNGTKAAYGFTQPLFNLTADETNYTTASFAIFSLVTASSLSAIAAHSSVQKFYDVASAAISGSYKWISSCFRNNENETLQIQQPQRTQEDIELMAKRAGVASLAFLLACCDSGTLYELAVQQSLSMHDFANVLALVSSSVALFSMSFWAVDEGLMYYVRGGDPKATILSHIDKIEETLSSMSDSAIKALKKIILINQGVIENTI